MKDVAKMIGMALIFALTLQANFTFAQKNKAKATPAKVTAAPENNQEILITVTTLHRNLDNRTGTMDNWKALEKEYFDKVTKKNDLIIGQEVLTHYFTPDNSEILLVTMYRNWADIENANAKIDALVKAAWPDEKARVDFFEKRQAYYSVNHSDEILQAYPVSKNRKDPFTKPMLWYIRKSHFSFAKDASEEDFRLLLSKYRDDVLNKNEYVKAYYPNVHAWGADRTEFTEVYVVDSLGDIEKMFDREEELVKTVWPDESKRKEYWDALDRHFTGAHGDYIYQSVPELTK